MIELQDGSIMDAFVDDELASPSPSKIFNGNLYTCPVGRLTSETKEKLKTGYIQRLFMVVLVYLRMLRRCT
jgi:hypothetical protein